MENKRTEKEFEGSWQIWSDEFRMVEEKHHGPTRLGFIILLKFFAIEGRFPEGQHEVPSKAVEYVAQQLKLEACLWSAYPWGKRTFGFHKAEIRKWHGFRQFTFEDVPILQAWLLKEAIPNCDREAEISGLMLE